MERTFFAAGGLVIFLSFLNPVNSLNAQSQAAEPAVTPTIAVMDLKANQTAQEEAQAAAEFLRSAVAKNAGSNYRIIDRNSIGTILSDLKLDIALGKDIDVAVRVGKILGAKMMVIGSLSKIQKRYYVSVQLLDVETAEVKSAASEEAASFKKVKKAADKIGKQLMEKLNAK
ncbi:MAG: hypothetical protein HY747_00710 [Elusimicrobia bacterium]|nr:hypothetical protein [Elusimicrobiota bacterium]